MRCDCRGGGSYPHHHSFGGTYPCEAPEACRGCGTLIAPVSFVEPPWPAEEPAAD